MEGGERMSCWEAERYSNGNGESIAWLSSSCGRSVVGFQQEAVKILELARGFQLAIGKRFEPYIGVV